MVARVTDVLNRESALASSLNPVNPWASKGEKQFKATGALLKALKREAPKCMRRSSESARPPAPTFWYPRQRMRCMNARH